MSQCRQELQAQGKPYPRSGCDKCGKWSPMSKECDAKLEADRKASEWEDTFGPDYTDDSE